MKEDVRQKKKQMLVALFIIAIMVLSTLGFVLDFSQPSQSTLEYNTHKFTQTTQGWSTKLNGQKRLFLFFPGQLEDISFPDEAKKILTSPKQVSLSYDSNTTSVQVFAELQFDLERRLTNYANVYVVRGISNSEGTALPTIMCGNATETVPVVFFRESNTTQVLAENNCIIAESSAPIDAVRIAERILYTVLGIMT